MKIGDQVRIKRNRPVYRISARDARSEPGKVLYYLQADADHPDAAKRVGDAFRWYQEHELTLAPTLAPG